MPVYKDYDQAQLDNQFDNRSRVPDFQHYLDYWTEKSEWVRNHLHFEADLSTGNHTGDKADLFIGSDSGQFLIFIHGGYWRSLDKHDFSFLAWEVQKWGLDSILINYPLAPDYTMADLSNACLKSVVFVLDHLQKRYQDSVQVCLAGHSAGAHLAALLLSDPSIFPFRDMIKGAVLISGIYDLLPVCLSNLNDTLKLSQEESKQLSPVFREPLISCPVMALVGEDESEEFKAQNKLLTRYWDKIPVTEYILAGENHFSIVNSTLNQSFIYDKIKDWFR